MGEGGIKRERVRDTEKERGVRDRERGRKTERVKEKDC